MKLNIIFEDNELLVCEKPPGVPSQSDKTWDDDMVNQIKNYLFQCCPDKGEPYVGVVHRLDRPVGGIMVFAKTPPAAKNLSSQIQVRSMKKRYLAIVTKDLSEEIGRGRMILTDCMVHDKKTNLSRIAAEKEKGYKKAELTYQVLSCCKDLKGNPLSLLEIELITGRHHQIRLQMSSHHVGIWGDTKYNPLFQKQSSWSEIALYACWLCFLHPKTKKKITFFHQPDQSIFNKTFLDSAPDMLHIHFSSGHNKNNERRR